MTHCSNFSRMWKRCRNKTRKYTYSGEHAVGFLQKWPYAPGNRSICSAVFEIGRNGPETGLWQAKSEVLGESSANLPLSGYGRFARHSGAISRGVSLTDFSELTKSQLSGY